MYTANVLSVKFTYYNFLFKNHDTNCIKISTHAFQSRGCLAPTLFGNFEKKIWVNIEIIPTFVMIFNKEEAYLFKKS
jgi:hypothetical protein